MENNQITLPHVRAPFTAVGTFQGDADWDVEVRVGGFLTREAAEEYANSFRIRLVEGKLFHRTTTGVMSGHDWREVPESNVKLYQLKQSAKDRIAAAHAKYAEQGMDNVAAAVDSLKVFEAEGSHPLVLGEDDYVVVALPISQWAAEPGLSGGFSSLSYGVEENFPAAQQGQQILDQESSTSP